MPRKRKYERSDDNEKLIILFGSFALFSLLGLFAFLHQSKASTPITVALPTQVLTWSEVEETKALFVSKRRVG